MSLLNLLKNLEQADAKELQQSSDRRDALKRFGSKVAIAAIPLAISSMFQKSYAKTTDTATVTGTLNFALELAYLQYNFYHTALATGSNTTSYLIPVADRAGVQLMADQERAHITYLRNKIDTLGGVVFTPNHYTGNPLTGDPYSPPSYDFTGSARYRVFEYYTEFLIIAQAIEDLVVRAYEGQVSNMLGEAELSAFLQMSTVHARQAAYIRMLRRLAVNAVDYPKPWVTNNVPPIIDLQSYYLGEDVTIQKGVDITLLNGVNGTIPKTAATEAFDEPMDKATVYTLLNRFVLA